MKKLIEYLKKHKKTAFLKVVLVILFIPVILIVAFAAPSLIVEAFMTSDIEFWYVLSFSFLIGLVMLPVGYAIVQTWRLCVYIENDEFYSEHSAQRFIDIKHGAIVASVLFAGMLPSIFYFAEIDDAPGLALLGLIFVGASIAVAVFSSLIKDLVLEKRCE